VEGVDLEGGLGRGRQGSLGAFAGGCEATDGAVVGRDVLAGFALELVDEMGKHAVVEVLAAEVSVARC